MERDANDLDITRTGTAGSSTGGSTTGSSATGAGGPSGAGLNTGSTAGTSTGGLHGGAAMNSGAALGDSAAMEAGIAGTASTGGSTGSMGAGGMGGTSTDGQAGATKDTLQSQSAAAREKLGQAGEKAREVKQNVERTLADRLEAGANRLRERGTTSGTPAFAGPTGAAAATSSEAERLDALQGNVARGMERTADWLRNGDLRGTVEEQARTNPGRTLLVALGVGYLLGKAFRR